MLDVQQNKYKHFFFLVCFFKQENKPLVKLH